MEDRLFKRAFQAPRRRGSARDVGGERRAARQQEDTGRSGESVPKRLYEVLSPLGEPAVEMVTLAPRPAGYGYPWGGKTIGALWNGGFRGDESFPIIETMLRERYPTVKLVPYTESLLLDSRVMEFEDVVY